MGWPLALPALIAAAEILENETVTRFMNLALGIMTSNINTKENLKLLNDQIQKFVDEEREPTDDEWQALADRSDEAHNKIQNA